jgi:hypothetical protein
MTHPHAPPESTAADRAFVRTFLVSFLSLLLLVAAVSLLVDPLGRFGTGLLPPILTNDRDQKAILYQRRKPRPQVVVLGSSRSKTIAPSCLERLTGHPAFNFAVNGAGSEDFLAILRFLRAAPGDSIRALFVGVDPETLQGTGGATRALAASRLLGPFLPTDRWPARQPTLGSDLFGWQAVSAAARSVSSHLYKASAADTRLEADGLQRYPIVEGELQAGHPETARRVAASIPGVLARYESFAGLDSERVSSLKKFVSEARQAGLSVTAFIPPVHPGFARVASTTAWAPRTSETVALLRALEREEGLRYVETRFLPIDSTQFVDAIHFLGPVADRIAEALTATPGGCALQ